MQKLQDRLSRLSPYQRAQSISMINAMLDLAVHDIAVVDYLLDGGEMDSISAFGTRFFGNQETITYLTMKKGETLININSSWISPVKIRKTVVAGTKKMVAAFAKLQKV